MGELIKSKHQLFVWNLIEIDTHLFKHTLLLIHTDSVQQSHKTLL